MSASASDAPRVGPGAPVRDTAQGTWFLPADGTAGSLLRLPPGASASAARRLARLGLPGLLPVDAVVEDGARVWVVTLMPPAPTVADLLAGIGLDTRKVAVERNMEIVPRSAYAETALEAGDALEIVHFIGGG